MKRPNRTMWGFVVVGLFVAVHVWAGKSGYEAAAQDITVDCDGGETVTAALDQAAPGTTILVSGTCMERVSITTDRITLDGAGTAIIDGGGAAPGPATEGVITVESAQGVILTGLTVQNGPDGILGRRGAALTISNTTVQDNADEGIQIDENATADLTDCTVQRSGDNGIVVFRSSSATFRGMIVSNDNEDDGVAVALSSGVFLDVGVMVTMNNNGDRGMTVTEASSLAAFFTDDQAVTITAEANANDGVGVFGSSSFVINGGTVRLNTNAEDGLVVGTTSSARFFNGATVAANGNGADGVAATADASIVFNGSMAEANNNGNDGLCIRLNSSGSLERGTTIATNQNGDDGISVSGGSHLTIFENTMVTSRENMDAGLVVFGNANLTMSDTAEGASTLLMERNTGEGLLVVNSSQAFAGPTTRLTVQSSGAPGVVVADASHLDLLGATTVSNNRAGGIAIVRVSNAGLFGNVEILDNAAFGLVIIQNSNVGGQDLSIMNNGGVGLGVDFSSVDIDRSTFMNHTEADIVLIQGTRADLTGITVGIFACDASVLLTGDTGMVCPTGLAVAALPLQ